MEELDENFEEIIETPQEPIKVYIKVNENNEIIKVESSIFLKDTAGWIEIDSGYGDKYAHAQSQYFDKPLMSEDGKYNFKYVDNNIVKIFDIL